MSCDSLPGTLELSCIKGRGILLKTRTIDTAIAFILVCFEAVLHGVLLFATSGIGPLEKQSTVVWRYEQYFKEAKKKCWAKNALTGRTLTEDIHFIYQLLGLMMDEIDILEL